MDEVKLVCFDVDGTLVDGISWFILTEGLGCSAQEHINIFERAKNGEISFIEGERMLTKMYQNGGKATRSFIKRLFEMVKPRPQARELIVFLKKRGYKVYLISGAIDIYVEEMAKKLGADGYFANSTLDFDEKGILEKIHYRDNQREVKVEQLKKLTQKLGIDMGKATFVGDSENDIDVFKKTGRGIAVHCFNEYLKKVAWKKVDSLNDIKRIL